MKFVSCFQCAMLNECWKTVQPSRDQARGIASACELPARGLTTDVLRVAGRLRGVSRKKAVRLFARGELQWLDPTTVVMMVAAEEESVEVAVSMRS